ncbi:unnamed protein product [Cylindrotheca closterium]|uniref:Uncharacterized protein n=1 Tax=Cylindrotheca closterium TaxID=2856 RepID=A0AAD2FFD1_9STRA|nr:unnamed protein product [Cylindrotheca closterium]
MPSVKLVKSETNTAAVRLPAIAESQVTDGKKIELAVDVTAANLLLLERLLPLKRLQDREKALSNQAVAVIAAKAIPLPDRKERVVLLLAKAGPPSQLRFLVR